jgi:redox-sensitive bicupin YhaK (pirin superfamily)
MTQANIKNLIEPRKKDLGGFSVRRVLPVVRQKMIGPWIFFDHMGPAEFPAGTGIDVRPHPHINLATVTYLFEGEILHRDSLGSHTTIEPGDINLMVAGSGIVHSERERDEIRNQPHRLHGLQLWLALPEADEETDPAFYHYDKAEIPGTQIGNVPVRVMMGSAYGLTSPVKVFADTLYIEAALSSGQSLLLPTAEERGLYVASGQLELNGQPIDTFHMAVLDPGEAEATAVSENCRIALIGGEHMGQRYIDWNFVSSRAERIERAKTDWQQQRFAKVPGDEEEYIPLP